MSYELVSVIAPVYRQADHVADVVRGFESALAKLPVAHELIVVVNGPADGTLEECRRLEADLPSLKTIQSGTGWGRAVQRGLAEASGDLICFTNSARTAADDLLLMILYALAHNGVIIKASRKTRDNWKRRLGSLIYNLECRALFDLSYFDVNGTPKVFPRECWRLLTLSRHDDLIDVEFNAVCRNAGYPMLEVPIIATRRHGGQSTTNYRSALKMYGGAIRLRRSLRKDPQWQPSQSER